MRKYWITTDIDIQSIRFGKDICTPHVWNALLRSGYELLHHIRCVKSLNALTVYDILLYSRCVCCYVVRILDALSFICRASTHHFDAALICCAFFVSSVFCQFGRKGAFSGLDVFVPPNKTLIRCISSRSQKSARPITSFAFEMWFSTNFLWSFYTFSMSVSHNNHFRQLVYGRMNGNGNARSSQLDWIYVDICYAWFWFGRLISFFC